MNNNTYQKHSDAFVSKILDITAVLTVVFYIVFSIIKRFVDNNIFFWIPMILFTINFLILSEVMYKVKREKSELTKNRFGKLVFQSVLNLAFAVFVLTYLI